MTNYKHLNSEQRNTIQYLLEKDLSFSKIGKSINVDRTTVSKEIKRNRYAKVRNNQEQLAFDKTIINNAVNNCDKLKTKHICNNCPNKNCCLKTKLYYNSRFADKHYLNNLVLSRVGYDITDEIIDEIELSIIPLIKNKNHSVNQVYINHSDLLYFSKSTFYRYVHNNVFSINDVNLPRKVKYKPRKEAKEDKRKTDELLKGRRYVDFIDFTAKHPKYHIVEMDTVIGKSTDSKCLLTIILRDTNYMIIRLIEKKSILGVNIEFRKIKEALGVKLYKKIFKVLLTDNGGEFFDVNMFEIDYETADKVCNLFYCDPYASWQKPAVEKNHHHIREVISKGVSMEDFTQEQIKLLEDNINNIPRDILDGKTPYEKTLELYPEFIHLLGCNYIAPDNVDRSKLFIKKD